LQEENVNDATCMLTPVKEELIKPEITFEDDDMLVGNQEALGLDNFFNFRTSDSVFERCSGDHSRTR
jgi:hypothetical protein